ncbi:MAG: hypothetical protein PVG63_03585 [Anaerolineales bacterium]|jgi:hypothetical protein
MASNNSLIGLVTRCSSQGFVGAKRLPETDLPIFGDFCTVEAQQGQSQVIGLIYDISIEDDEFARQMAAAEDLDPKQIEDQRLNRLLPVEISALSVGFRRQDLISQALPPQPPISMAPIRPLSDDEVIDFTRRLDFIPLVLSARHIPCDDLVAAMLMRAAARHLEDQRHPFLLEAGRICAGYLAHDLSRLEYILNALRQPIPWLSDAS